ncbi:MAG TPA: hydrolase [Terriglobia bacterium]|nr:hydrolase [Terriglobia bacterium]
MLIEHAGSQLVLIDVQEKLLPAMADPGGVTRQIAILLAAARAMKVPVIASEQYPAGLGRTVQEIGGQLQPGEIVEKTEFSCYANPKLRLRLDTGPTQLVLAGVEAHVCVLQTALDLLDAGRRVFIVADATSSRRAESKSIALQRLAAAGAVIVTAEMVLFEWLRQSDRPEFKTLSRLIR